MNEPRVYTADEVRQHLVDHVRLMINYWHRQDGTDYWRMEGLAFSILVALDGGSANLPKFIVAPDPHPEDEAYCRENGENWYPQTPEAENDISGCLYELLHK